MKTPAGSQASLWTGLMSEKRHRVTTLSFEGVSERTAAAPDGLDLQLKVRSQELKTKQGEPMRLRVRGHSQMAAVRTVTG